MNKNKGFTLIELLGTIVIIGILGTVAITSVVNIKKSTNNKFNKSQIELVKRAGQTYFTDNKRLLPIVEGQTNFVTLGELIEKGYISKLYNSKKEEFDINESYVWVQKQESGTYKYDCYCEIKGVQLAGTNEIPKSKANNSIVTFEYENFYNNKSEKKYYTNGKNNSIVKVHLNRNEVSEYRYEIYKKDTNDENSQYKISQREKLTTNLVNIKLNAKDYSDGEYFIKVTTYNSTGNSNQSNSSAKIYVDKTPPTCNITTDYKIDESSKQSLWYNSKSKNSSNQELGIDKELPIVVSGSDEGSGVNESTKHIFSDRSHLNKLDNDNGKYSAGNTGKNGKEYYATIEDNVGNKASCSQLYYIDTTPPKCESSGGSNSWINASSEINSVTLKGICTEDNESGCATPEITKTVDTTMDKNEEISPGKVKDKAGNESKDCPVQKVKVDKTPPTCTIMSEFKPDENSENKAWYSSNSKNSSNKSLGKAKVSFYVSGKDETSKIFATYFTENERYNISVGDTGRGGKELDAKVIDNAGNENTCVNTVWVDTTLPTCTISTEYEKDPNSDNQEWYSSNSKNKKGEKLGQNGKLPIDITYEDSGSLLDKAVFDNKITYVLSGSKYQYGQLISYAPIQIQLYDKAGNYIDCGKDLKVDTTPPRINEFSLIRQASAEFNTITPDVNINIYDRNKTIFSVRDIYKDDMDDYKLNNKSPYSFFSGYLIYLESSNDENKVLEYGEPDPNNHISVSEAKKNVKSKSQQWYLYYLGNNNRESNFLIIPAKYQDYILTFNSNQKKLEASKKSKYNDEYWNITGNRDKFSIKSVNINSKKDNPISLIGRTIKGNYDSASFYLNGNTETSNVLEFQKLYNEVTLPEIYDISGTYDRHSYDNLYDGKGYALSLNVVDLAGNEATTKSNEYHVYRKCSELNDEPDSMDENFSGCQLNGQSCSDSGVGMQYKYKHFSDKYLKTYCMSEAFSSQECALPTCCSSTYTAYDSTPKISYSKEKKCVDQTVTEEYTSALYSIYNDQKCGEAQSIVDIYDDEIQKECTKWSTCSNGKQTRKCTEYHDYDESSCGSPKTESRECKEEKNVSCNAGNKVFGNYKGSNKGNYGKWVSKTFSNCNGNVTVVGGYERKCIIDACKGMTAKQVNKKWDCNYSTLWCNSRSPNAVKW